MREFRHQAGEGDRQKTYLTQFALAGSDEASDILVENLGASAALVFVVTDEDNATEVAFLGDSRRGYSPAGGKQEGQEDDAALRELNEEFLELPGDLDINVTMLADHTVRFYKTGARPYTNDTVPAVAFVTRAQLNQLQQRFNQAAPALSEFYSAVNDQAAHDALLLKHAGLLAGLPQGVRTAFETYEVGVSDEDQVSQYTQKTTLALVPLTEVEDIATTTMDNFAVNVRQRQIACAALTIIVEVRKNEDGSFTHRDARASGFQHACVQQMYAVSATGGFAALRAVVAARAAAGDPRLFAAGVGAPAAPASALAQLGSKKKV